MPVIEHAVVRKTIFESPWATLEAPGIEYAAGRTARAHLTEQKLGLSHTTRLLQPNPRTATAACFSPEDGRYCAVGALDGRVLVWDFQTLRTVVRFGDLRTNPYPGKTLASLREIMIMIMIMIMIIMRPSC
jgi:hypothetical protein